MRLVVLAGPLEGGNLRFGEHQPVLGALGLECLQSLTGGLQAALARAVDPPQLLPAIRQIDDDSRLRAPHGDLQSGPNLARQPKPAAVQRAVRKNTPNSGPRIAFKASVTPAPSSSRMRRVSPSRCNSLVASAARISAVRCACACRQTASRETWKRSAIARFAAPVAIARSICGRAG